MSDEIVIAQATPTAPVVAPDATAPASTPASSAPITTPAPAQTDPAKPAAAGTIATGNVEDAKIVTPADWPEDWRSKLAGDDKTALKSLERYNSPADMAKALREAQKKISSGSIKSELSKDATPEEVAAWRKDQGIPDAPDGYDVKVKGLVWGEADKPLLEDFTKFAHEKNMTPAQVKTNLEWYAQHQEQQMEARRSADLNFQYETGQSLKKEWGADYTRNVNAIKSMTDSLPDGADWIFNARTEDGKILGNHPLFIKWLSGAAREINPVATLLPQSGANPAKGVGERLIEITKLMGDGRSEYWKGPNAENLQKEFRDLADAQQKLRSRSGA